MVDEQLGKTAYLAGDAFSYGDIPVGIMAYRYRQLVPDRPPLKNFERWYAAISARQAFKDQVACGAADVVPVIIRERVRPEVAGPMTAPADDPVITTAIL